MELTKGGSEILEIDNDIKIIADAINTFGSCTMHILPKDKEEKLTELGYEISRKSWGIIIR